MKVYLTISDYNSWQDIYTVQIILENNDVETAKFQFKQYENKDSFNEIKEFSELTDEDLLYEEKCTSSHADNTDSISNRVLLDLLFVFYPSGCTRLNIITRDRGGLSSTTYFDISTGGLSRSDKTINLPWTVTPVDMSSYTIDAIAFASAVTIIAIFFRKGDIKKRLKEGKA